MTTDTIAVIVGEIDRKIRWRERELANLRGQSIKVDVTMNLIGRHETALDDLRDLRAMADRLTKDQTDD